MLASIAPLSLKFRVVWHVLSTLSRRGRQGRENLQPPDCGEFVASTRRRICIASHSGEFAAFQAAVNSIFKIYELIHRWKFHSANSPQRDPCCKFSATFGRKFPVAYKATAPPRYYQYRNWGRSWMMTTQHAVDPREGVEGNYYDSH